MAVTRGTVSGGVSVQVEATLNFKGITTIYGSSTRISEMGRFKPSSTTDNRATYRHITGAISRSGGCRGDQRRLRRNKLSIKRRATAVVMRGEASQGRPNGPRDGFFSRTI